MPRLWNQFAIVTNWPVLAGVFVLTGLGVVSIWADTRLDPAPEWPKQIIFLGIGVALMLGMQLLSYQAIGRFAWGFYLFSIALLVYTILPGVPRSGLLGVPLINGAHAWINFGPVSLQPAELTKISFVMVLARYLRFRSNYRTLPGLLPPFALALVPVGLMLKQPDLGTALTFIPALFAMLFVAGARFRHLFIIVGLGAACVPLAWYSGTDVPVFRHLPELVKQYQRDRVYAMFSTDPSVMQRKGFQQERALVAFGSGGWTGKGLGVIPVGRSIPEAHNDMIFALIGEQFGLIGAIGLVIAYVVLFAAGVEISAATREPFGKLLALGLVSLLAGQACLNLLVCLRLMPVTGVTLPFVSYGGSSLLASFIAAALLINIGKNRPMVMARNAFEFEE